MDKVSFKDGIEAEHVVENHIIKKAGNAIKAFTGANTTLVCLLMKFASMEEMLGMMDKSRDRIEVVLKR